MLNVYDIRIDESGTNGSNLNGNVIFDATDNGRLVLTTSNIKEHGDNLYFSESRKNESTAFFDNIYVRNNDTRLFNENILVVKKNAGVGEYNRLYDAIQAIEGNTLNNFIKISIGPGVFIEPELFIPPYVSIIGEGIQDTTIIPSGNHHVFHIQNIYNELSFFGINSASSGYAGIYIDDAGNYSQIHKITFNNCDINILIESNTRDTYFYGEYLDYNGTYTYGTKIISNNGFIAFANLENYYNLPSSTNNIGNYFSGVNTIVYIATSGNIGSGTSGTAIYIDNGAKLTMTATNIENWDLGFHNGNVGTGIELLLSTILDKNNSYDILIEHPTSIGTVEAICDIEKIKNNSPNSVSLLLQGISDGSLTVNGTINGVFGNVITDVSTLIVGGGAMGVMYGGNLTSTSGLILDISAGFGYLTTPDGTLKKVLWSDFSINILPNTRNYIYFNENSIITQNSSIPNYVSNILLGRVGTTNTGFEFISNNSINISNVGDKYAKALINGFGAVYASGSIVSKNATPLHLNVSQGTYYIGTSEIIPSGGNNINFISYYKNNSSGWVLTNSNVLDNANFNGTNGGLVSLPSNQYAKYSLYTVSDDVNEKYFLIYPQEYYNTLVAAEQALLPTPPSYFTSDIVLISSIIIQQGNANIVEIRDNRPILGSIPQGVSASIDHSSLLNLNHDDHLQYLLVSGARAMTGNLNMGSNNITSVGNVNGVVVENHASRHLPNGSDPLTTGTPSSVGTSNQVGVANAFARQDHIHALNNNVVTYNKIQQLSGKKLLGNPNNGSGNVQELALTSGISLSGNTIGILNNAINYAKIQQVSGNKILGRVGSTGIIQEISVTSGLTLSGLTLGLPNSGIISGTYNFITFNNNGIATSASTKPYLTGNQTITLSGDINGFGTSGITTTIGTNKVTYAKIQQVSGNKLLGRVGVLGNIEEISVTSGLTLSGLTLGMSNSGVVAGTYNNFTVNSKGIITSAFNKIPDNKLITLSGDVSGSGTAGITTTIGSNKVTYAKFQQVSGNKILGRVGVLGNVEEISVTSGLTLSGLTLGLSNSGVVAGTYNFITFNNKGIATSASTKPYLTGNQTITLSGDATGSGSSGISVTIGANKVTYAKIQQVSGNKILGNPSGILGNVQELALTSGLSLSGNALGLSNSGVVAGTYNNITVNSKGIATSASNKDYITNQTITLSGDATGSGSSGISVTIGANKVTYAKIQQISGNKILGRVGVLGNIQEISVTSGLSLSGNTLGMSNSGVVAGTYNSFTVNSKGIITNATTKSYGAGSQVITLSGDVSGSGTAGITTTIGANKVTYAKIQQVSGNKILGNPSEILGNVKELALTSGLSLSGNTIGLSNSGVVAGTYNSVAVNSKGIITSASNKDYITNQTITLSGDITGSGSSGISTTIGSNKVTYTKIQQVSGNKLLGNPSGVLGNIQEIQTTSGISFNGITLQADYTNATFKIFVRAKSSSASTVTYANGVNGVGATLTNAGAQAAFTADSVTLNVGDRVLMTNQASTFQNGIYVVTNAGSVSTNWVLTRATDSNTAIQLYNASINVKEGTIFATTLWLCNNASQSITIGTTGITYTLSGGIVFSGAVGISNKSVTVQAAGITRAMLANSNAVSVIGRSANSAGVPADIGASSDGQVLKRVGGVVGFNAIGTGDLGTNIVTYSNIQKISGNKILGNPSGILGNAKELALTSGLAFSGNTLKVSPAGSNGNIQFNNSSGLGSDTRLFWNNTIKSLSIGSSNPNSSTILDLTSTAKGFGLPSMTKAQRIAISTPKNGLMVYENNSGTSGVLAEIDNTWVKLNRITRQYQFSLGGVASNTIGQLTKAGNIANSTSNPSGLPTTASGNPGLNNGGIDPYQIMGNEYITRMRLTFASAAVSQGSTGLAPTIRIDIYNIGYSTRTLIKTVRIPISPSNVGTFNNVGANGFQTISFNASIPLGNGILMGCEFVNESTNYNNINAISRLQMVVETTE